MKLSTVCKPLITGLIFMCIFVTAKQILIQIKQQRSKIQFKRASQNLLVASERTHCETLRPKPTFLKVPDLKNSSCIRNPCVMSKRIKWKMVIFAKSSVRNFALRELVRRTWASLSFVGGAQFQTVFVVGSAGQNKLALLDEEERRYHDLLQIDVPDVQGNVQEKSLASLYWAVENLPSDYFYAEADDDVLINIGHVEENISEFKTTSSKIHWPEFPMVCMNTRQHYGTPNRDPNKKHYYSTESYKWPFWPDYCIGGMYAVSLNIARGLWQASRTEIPFSISDVWITGILREKMGLSKQMVVEARPTPCRHVPGFSAEKPDSSKVLMQHHWKKMHNYAMTRGICTCDYDYSGLQRNRTSA